jgi:dihydroorotate dehydrogenase
MYKALFNIFFRRLDAEFAHHLGALIILFAGLLPAPPRKKRIEVSGIQFGNRIGMAAGFDKNAKLVRGLYRLGFGHVEIGTVTPRPQSGNAKPRLFRIPELRALINRMGFNNDGAAVIGQRLKRLREENSNLPVIGVNIGKSKLTEPGQAADDYAFCAKELAQYADYLVVNVSSPNTPGLRDLQQIDSLRPILQAVKENSGSKPIFVKISPDSTDEDLLEVAKLINDQRLAGVIATNTTVTRPVGEQKVFSEAGGLSGQPLAARAKEVLILLRAALPDKVIVSVGGIETAADVKERLSLGADLVQGYTGFVYFGPNWAKELSKGE